MRSALDVKVTSGLGIVVFIVQALVKGAHFSESVLSFISSAVSITVLVRLFYVKWIWKWMPLVIRRVPLLEGKWEGNYESTGNEKTPVERKTGAVQVSILQPDLYSIRVIRRSDESMSTSFGESLSIENETIQLLYSYRSEPKATVRERSPISYGTARLRTNSENPTCLEGDYWTDQKTTGAIKFIKTQRNSVTVLPSK